MKNSKGETLPQPYLDLARMRREQKNGTGDDISDLECFEWGETPEGFSWWNNVDDGEYPEIFASSLAELEAWRKAKVVANHLEAVTEAAEYKAKCDELQANYATLLTDFDRVVGEANELTSALKELGAKYEEMKADRDYYRHEYELKCIELDDIDNKPTPTRNWVAECAMAILSNTPAGVEASWDLSEAWAADGRKRKHID